MTDQARDLIDEMHRERLTYAEYNLLRDALDILEWERDEAMKDLREVSCCQHCAHATGSCPFEQCVEGEHWQWRGVQNDNEGKEPTNGD